MDLEAFAIGLAVGIMVAGAAAALIFANKLKRRTAEAKLEALAEGQAKIAPLQSLVSSLTTEVAREKLRADQNQETLKVLRNDLAMVSNERARSETHASRVPILEEQNESLHKSLIEETRKCALLGEQSSKMPELHAKLEAFILTTREQTGRIAGLEQELTAFKAKLTEDRQRLDEMKSKLNELTADRDSLAIQKEQLRVRAAQLESNLKAEQDKNPEKLGLIEKAKEEMASTFKLIGNSIFEEKSSKFTKQNQENIERVLDPLKNRIGEFRKKVDDVYKHDSEDRIQLKTQVSQLMSLSEKVSDDAKSLAEALRGSSKTQGNWGEMILETVLESSGLRKGHEYELRETYYHDDGSRRQPDVIINLPEERQIVIDSKVSLTDYDRSVNSTSDQERAEALSGHVTSVRRHIKQLSEKNYHQLYDLKSIDFVVMFVPLEPAFAAAIEADKKLWDEGFKSNVLLVSPTSLLFVLRTVAYLWRQEAQVRNVREIAKCGGDLYDKFVGFTEDMKGLGKQLRKSQDSYEHAYKKLSQGNGNLVSRADALVKLGVAPKKILAPELLEGALEQRSTEPEENEQEATQLVNTVVPSTQPA